MIYQGEAKYPVDEVVLHCAAIKTGQFAHMSAFQVFATVNRWHVERGFRGFGYHGLVMPDGRYLSGRPWSSIGAHVRENNRGTLGLLLVESREIKGIGEFGEYFTEAQRNEVVRFVRAVGVTRLSGHNDYAPKLCPGFRVRGEVFPELSPRSVAFGKRPFARGQK